MLEGASSGSSDDDGRQVGMGAFAAADDWDSRIDQDLTAQGTDGWPCQWLVYCKPFCMLVLSRHVPCDCMQVVR